MNILISGIAGFLGSHIADALDGAGHSVTGIDDMSGGRSENIQVMHDKTFGAKTPMFGVMDVCNESAVESAFNIWKPDAIVHCAAFASENLSHNCRLHTYRSIVQGSATLVNAAVNHGVKLFISMSSIAVYGNQPPPFRELDSPSPADPYGAAKLCSEYDLKAAHEHFGLNYAIFRPHNVIGTRQSLADSTRNVASIFIRQALSGKPLTIFGDGEQTRAFSPVSHVAAVIAACVDRPATWNATYNVGGNEVMQVNWLAEAVSRLCGVEHRVEHLPERKEAKHAHSLHVRVRRAFQDIETHETVENCLKDMIAEARKNPLPEVKPLPRIEIAKNLNPAWTR